MYLNKFKKANKIFTDRVEPKIFLQKELSRLKNTEEYKKIVNFFGIGGIGKTRFLKEMKYKEEKTGIINFIQISFDTYEYDTPVKILLCMRKQFEDIDFTFFDYALIQYYQKNGFSSKDILDKMKTMKSGISDTLMMLSDIGASEFIPYYSVAKNLFKGLKEVGKYLKYKKYEADFKSIEELTANEIYLLLPKMLADGINEANRKILFYLDDFESMLKRIKDKSISDDSLRWLIDFFIETKSVLLVIASRDKINFSYKYPQLAEYTTQYYLDKLSVEDSKMFLRTVPIQEEKIINQIATLSSGIPLYLDMCADLYVKSEHFDFHNLSIQEIIDRHLRHLELQERELILYLSYLNSFENDFVCYLAKAKNIAISDQQVNDFLELSIFVETNEYKKIDSSVKLHIFEGKLNEDVSGICTVLRNYLTEKITIEQNNYIHYFNQLIYLYGKKDRTMDSVETESIVYMIARLIDRGNWISIEKNINQANKSNPHFSPIFNYFNILWLRRTGKIKEAKIFYEQKRETGFDSSIYGKMKSSYEMIYVQTLHLMGNYEIAMEKYSEMISNYELFGASAIELRTVYLAKIKYADILFLKGSFNQSMNLVNQFDLNKLVESEIKMEVLRVKAHIYRFNYMFDQAIKIYSYILENESSKDIKILGNIYTNLAESYALVDPEQALAYSEKSLEINTAIQSAVEIGKTYAARAIAFGRLNQIEKGIEEANKAIDTQVMTGYKAGVLFGKIAKLFLEFSYNQSELTQEKKKLIIEINEIISEIKVYSYLCLLINKVSKQDIFEVNEIDWLNKETAYKDLV